MAHPISHSCAEFTYADYLTWPDDERWEIIDGVPYLMSSSRAVEHQEVLADVGTQFRAFLRGKTCRVIPDCDVLLPKSTEPDAEIRTVVRPDLAIVCAPEKIEGKRIRGAPDLVVEIVSPASASYDHVKKKYMYDRAGVKEYWLVDSSSRCVTVYVIDPATGRYAEGNLIEGDGKIPVGVLPGLEIDFATVFPPRPKVVREPPREYRVLSD